MSKDSQDIPKIKNSKEIPVIRIDQVKQKPPNKNPKNPR